MVSRLSMMLVLALVTGTAAADQTPDPLARDLFRQLVEINTTASIGNVTLATGSMATALRAAGFTDADLQILGPSSRKQNLIVRLRGRGLHRPVLLMGHLDVVEARREDWHFDPFRFTEKDGVFYGRGTQDMKDGDAILVATLIRLHKEGYRPSRDIILALTADEEAGDENGIDWLLRHRRDLVDAEFAINHDGASIVARQGIPLRFEVAASEKVYADFRVSAASPGGHSSLPVAGNAIYRLVAGLARLEAYRFPLQLNPVTRAYYEQLAAVESGPRASDIRAILASAADPAAEARLSANPADNAMLHTTCVATRLEGGHANNALPQTAAAVVNCRILPGSSPEEVRRTLGRVLADSSLRIEYIDYGGQLHETAEAHAGSPVPRLLPEVFGPLGTVVNRHWPGLPVIPSMMPFTSDGVYTAAAGLPTYEVSGIALDEDNARAHGQDENLPVKAFDEGAAFFYDFLKELTAR